MAPLLAGQEPRCLSSAELQEALEGRSDAELEEMGRRLERSQEQFTEMFELLEAEKEDLRDENRRLNETITLMMSEMRKLNIGAFNTVEPQLEEGPLDFVGRIWEKVKPRDTAYMIDEHVGEIKKPVPQEDVNLSQQIPQEIGKHVAQRFAVTFGPWWQKAEGFVHEAKGEISKRIAEHQKQAAESPAMDEAVEVPKKKEKSKRKDAGAKAAAEKQEAVVTEQPANDEDTQESAILIEAQIKLEDGSVKTLHLRATDRCKEVTTAFIQEHSLKAWFKEPLTKWLKQVEADAVQFPINIEADLVEIRKQYQKPVKEEA